MTDYFTFFKQDSRTWFDRSCQFCYRNKDCISATSFTTDKRKHLLHIKGFREKQTARMLKGIEMHKEKEEDLKTIDEYGVENIKNDLHDNKLVVLRDVKVHSRFFGYRGFIDVLGIKHDSKKGRMDIHILEIKTSFRKNQLFQLGCYASMVSDSDSTIFHDKGEFNIHPRNPVSLNIHLGLWVERFQKLIKWEFMENGAIVGPWKGYVSAMRRRQSSLRSVHKFGVYNIHEIPRCRECYETCGFYKDICSKIDDVNQFNDSQRYFAKRVRKGSILKKTKPFSKTNSARVGQI